jgi:hypothetical protein
LLAGAVDSIILMGRPIFKFSGGGYVPCAALSHVAELMAKRYMLPVLIMFAGIRNKTIISTGWGSSS